MAGEEDLPVHTASTLDIDASRAEFEELARSAGATIAATLVQRRQKPDPSSLVGQGKLDEIVGIVASTNASLVLFDHDLTPSQLRNIEARLPCHVIDRSQLILDIFARHAKTSEGQLQVELAQLEYQLPRLAGRGRGRSLVAVSEPAAQAKPSLRPIAARSTCASTTSRPNSTPSVAFAISNASAARQSRFRWSR
jgi:GTPase